MQISSKVENQELIKNIKEISNSASSIISTIEKNPDKYKKLDNFFDYYLPSTLKILRKYDEIENQRLSSEEGKKFMNSTEEMIKKINQSFKTQLSNLYQSDMIDTDAEMKIFSDMLNIEGYSDENDFKTK